MTLLLSQKALVDYATIAIDCFFRFKSVDDIKTLTSTLLKKLKADTEILANRLN